MQLKELGQPWWQLLVLLTKTEDTHSRWLAH